MPEFESNIDISVEDFYHTMSTVDINEFINLLISEKYISQMNVMKDKSVLDSEWDNICSKLSNNRLFLSNEDEKIIKEISNKY